MNNDLTQAYRTAYLVAGFIRQTLSEEEREELDEWILASDDNMRLFEELTDEQNIEQSLAWFRQLDTERALTATKKRIQFSQPPKKKMYSWHYAVAASLVLVICALVYYFRFYQDPIREERVAIQEQDISPGGTLATLKMENGKTVVLSGIADTAISEQVRVVDGALKYDVTDNLSSTMHELFIPRKAHYRLVLADGTRVWLNAESSMTFPSAFAGNERRVTVTGEAYFEVAHDAAKPFIVTANGMETQALGTQFNVNAYANEETTSTTLVEGSVRINRSVILKPGESASIQQGKIAVSTVETAAIIAWKNDQFKFRDASIQQVMRQLERWYDVQIEYKDEVKAHFNGTIDRQLPVSRVLQLLEATGHVHFTIENQKITVMK